MKKTIIGLIGLIAIAAAVIFAGCVEKEAPAPTPTPTTPTYTPKPIVTPTPTPIPTPTPTPIPSPTPTPVISEFNVNVVSGDTKLTKETFQTYTDCELPDWFMIDFCCAFKGTKEIGHKSPSFCLVIQNTGNTRIKNLKVDAEVRIIGCDQDGKPWRSSPPDYDLWAYFFDPKNGVLLNKNPSTYEADEVISMEPMGAVNYVVLPTAQGLGKGLHRMEIDLYVYSQDPPLSWHKIVYYVIEKKT